MSGLTDNTEKQRFEISEKGLLAFAEYHRRADGSLSLTHVEADPALRGTGAAARLMEQIVAHAREHGLLLVPRCPYAVIWFGRHKDAQDVLA